MTRRKNFGSTLLECLVGILILGITCSLSVYTWRQNNEQRVLRQEAARLAGLIEELLLKAQSAHVQLHLEIQEGSYRWGAEDALLGSRILPPKIKLESSYSDSEVFFNSSGANSPASIKLSLPRHSCTVLVSLRGRVKNSCQKNYADY